MRKNKKSKAKLHVDLRGYSALSLSSCCSTSLVIFKTLALVLFFYCCSISLTFYNKWLFKGFPYPLSVTIVHLTVKFLIAAGVRSCLRCLVKRDNIVLPWRVYMTKVAPTGLCTVLDIGLSNRSLLYITVSLYTMSKSTAVIFILMFAIIFGLQKVHICQIIIVVLIAVGLFMFTYESTQFNLEGFIMVIVASIISGVRWSCAQIITQKEDLGITNPLDTIYHLQPVMILGLMPFAIYIEGLQILSCKVFISSTDLNIFLWTCLRLAIGAGLAFMLGMSEYLLLSKTSSLTLSIAGIFKEICILYIATKYSGDMMSVLNFYGMIICLSGIAVHVILKAVASKGSTDKDVSGNADQEQLLMTNGTANSSDDDEDEEIFHVQHVQTRL